MLSFIKLGFLVKWNLILTSRLKHNFFGVLLVVFVLKLLMAGFMFWLIACDSPDRVLQLLATSSGDHTSYIAPVRNFFEKGSYFFHNTWGEVVYAGRTPTYGLIYYLLNLLTLGHGYTATVLAQIALEVFVLCYAANYLASKRRLEQVALLFLILMVISSNHTFWSTKIQPESISTSLLLLLAVLFDKAKSDNLHIWITALLLAVLTTLKPYYGVLYVLFISQVLWSSNRYSTRFIHVAKLAVPLGIFLLFWGARNYQVTGKLIIFTEKYSGYAYTESEIAMRKLGATTGLSWVPWYPNNFGYFMSHETAEINLPDYLMQASFYDSLLAIKSDYIAFRACCEKNSSLDQRLSDRIYELNHAIKESFPFQIHVMGPIRHFASLTIHSGAWYYPVGLGDRTCGGVFSDLDKILQAMLYYLGLFLFIPGCILMRKKELQSLSTFILFTAGFLMIFFPFVIKYTEYRYFVQTYPLLLLAGVYCLYSVGRFQRFWLR